MKTAWILAALAAFVVACGENGPPARVEGERMVLTAELEPASPRSGSNRLLLRLVDETGAPIEDAEVDAEVTMPAMGAMPAMGGGIPVRALGDGRYEAPFDLSMDGTWQVSVLARSGERRLRAEGSLLTGSPGLRLRGRGPAPRSEAAHDDHAGHAAHAGGAGAPAPGEVQLDPARLQKIGVEIAPVERAPFVATVRALGLVEYDPGTLVDVAPRIAGFVGEVPVPAAGESVRRGELLFTYYAPELFAAQKELLTALAARDAATPSARARNGALVESARTRLRLLGLPPDLLARVEETRAPVEYVAYRAPISGVVTERNAIPGAAAEAGEVLFRLASVDRVWIEAQIYESELRLVAAGDPARITLPYLPGETLTGRVALVEPELERGTRTARARIELENPGRKLLPGMWADVVLERPLGERLTVPASAVLYAGERSFVFVDLGEGRLRPRAIETGLREGDRLEVLAGLEPGERIVVSGNYLVASESRLESAMESW